MARALIQGVWASINPGVVTGAPTNEVTVTDVLGRSTTIKRVQAASLDVGEILGIDLANDGTVTAELNQYDSAGMIINALSLNVTTAITTEAQTAADNFKAGNASDADIATLNDLILNCREALAAAV